MGNMFRAHGIGKGDRVAIYMPCCTLAVATMLACARIGAIHSIIFAGFSADSLASRINDAQCCAIVTANQSLRGGKLIELKKTVEKAIEKCSSIKNVFIMRRTPADFSINEDEIIIDDVIHSIISAV
jgi:acetyl-CoA synthetase